MFFWPKLLFYTVKRNDWKTIKRAIDYIVTVNCKRANLILRKSAEIEVSQFSNNVISKYDKLLVHVYFLTSMVNSYSI